MAFATCPQNFQEFTEELDKFLHGESLGIFKDIFQKIERDLEIRRLNVALGFLACLTLFFLASDCAHFLCNFIGFAYPACVIILAVEQGRVELDNKKWLTYWTIYNAFSFVENFLPMQPSILRPYALVKCAVLVLCFLPVPWNGSVKLHNDFIHPFLQRHHNTITERALHTWEGVNKGGLAVILLYWTYVWGFRFPCNIVGFIYPAYISMISLMNDSEMDLKCWLTYWVVFSSCVLSEYVFSTIPLYYPVKFILLGTFMLEPLVKSALCHYGQRLILWYKPMNYASRMCHKIALFFVTPHQASHNVRVNQIKRYPPGVLNLQKIALREFQDTIVKAEQLLVDPQEVNLYLSSPMVQAVLEMDVDEVLIKKAIKLKLARDGHNFTRSEDLLEAVYDLTIGNDIEEEGSDVDKSDYINGVKSLLKVPHSLTISGNIQNPLEVIEENRVLKDQRMCKICMTGEVEIVFVPCGHLVCCNECSTMMTTCPICRMDIKSAQRAYMS